MTPMALRADANAEIGAGHVIRSLALADRWQRASRQEVTWFAADAPPRLREAAARQGVIAHTSASADEAWRALLAWVHANRSGWVVIDSYTLGPDAHRAVVEAGARLLVIDDCALLPEFTCDVLVNQNINADRLQYRTPQTTRRLLGPSFALLRREFVGTAPSRTFDTRARRLLVTFGGADVHDQAARVARLLRRLTPPIDAVVVAGQAHPVDAHEERVAAGVVIRWENGTDDMAALLRWADLVICAGGSTCWELAHLGVPALTLILSENQQGIATGLDEAGVIRSAGWFDAISDDALAAAIETLRADPARAEMARRGRALVDGHGADRVVDAMRLVSAKRDGVTLRHAHMDDAARLYSWRIDGETVRNSIAPPPGSLDEHRAWLEATLRDPRTALYVAYDADRDPVGVVRIDRVSDDEAEISITVDPDHRGRGYSHELIAAGVEAAGNVRVVARVKGANVQSLRAFRKQGFSGGGDGDLLRLVYDPAAVPGGRS